MMGVFISTTVKNHLYFFFFFLVRINIHFSSHIETRKIEQQYIKFVKAVYLIHKKNSNYIYVQMFHDFQVVA